MSLKENPVNWFEFRSTTWIARRRFTSVIGTNLDVFEMGGVRMAWFPRPGNAVRSSGGLIQAPGRVSPRVAQRQI